MSPILDALAAELGALVELCGGALELDREDGRLGLAPRAARGADEDGQAGHEALELRVEAGGVALEFGGWREAIELDDDELGDGLAEVRDFAAAAMFGELRVVELGLGDRVLQRSLECEVEGVWRRHGRRGRLGLAGVRARIARRLERRVRSNRGRVARPEALREAGCRGLPSAPWIGAAGDLDTGAAAELAIDGELDLHNFSPKEVGPLVREYIEVCRARGILDLRVVHGKGKGVLRRTVHSVLDGHPAVEHFRLGGAGEGSWGATIVRLRDR